MISKGSIRLGRAALRKHVGRSRVALKLNSQVQGSVFARPITIDSYVCVIDSHIDDYIAKSRRPTSPLRKLATWIYVQWLDALHFLLFCRKCWMLQNGFIA